MKTSNKLLIVLLLLLPLLLVVHDLLLKGQYMQGNISKRSAGDERAMVTHDLKPFRHVVFDGQMMYTHGNQRKVMGTEQQLVIKDTKSNSYRLEVSERRVKTLQYTCQGDTLYISYQLKNLQDKDHNFLAVYSTATLYVPEVYSVTARGSVRLDSMVQEAPMSLFVEPGRNISAGRLRVPVLKADIGQIGHLNLTAPEIDTLAYNMADEAGLAVKRPYIIHALKPGTINVNSTFTLSGSGPDMEQMLPQHPGKEALTNVKQ